MRKLYVFTNTKGGGFSGFEICYAMADDGVVLASHACSHIGFAKGDLITNRPERKEMYKKHFGGELGKAFEIEVLTPGETPPKEVIELNQKLGKEANAKSSNCPSISISVEENSNEQKNI